MELSKVTFPTFVLEPRSMLERITDFMAHPDLLFGYISSKSTLVHTHSMKSSVPKHATTPKSASSACCNTTSQAGTSNRAASRNHTIPYWASSSGAGTTIRMAHRDITSPSKVRLHH